MNNQDDPRSTPSGTKDREWHEGENRLTWMLVLLALSGWSYVAIWAANREVLPSFYPLHFLAWTALFFAFGLVIAWLVQRWIPGPRRWDGGFLVGVVAVILLQSWERILDLHQRVSASIGDAGAGVLLATAFALALRLAARAAMRHRLVPAFIGVGVAFLVGYQYLLAAQLVLTSMVGQATASEAAAAVLEESVADHSDVLVVIVDGYGSNQVLADRFGHDNSEFVQSLSEIGIDIVEGAKANYSLTSLSVASLLDGRYPAIGSPADARLDELQNVHSGDNALFTALDRGGFHIHMFDNAWTFTRCGTIVDLCHRSAFNELDHAVVSRTPALTLLPSFRINPWVRGSVDQLREAAALAAEPSERPRLIYLHALIPHAPFQLDSKCEERFDPTLSQYEFGSTEDVPGAAYIEQLICVNALLSDLLEAMPDDAVILVTGDHGPRWAGGDPAADVTVTDLQALTRVGTFTAYRFPGRCDPIPDSASLIETSTALFDCLGISNSVIPEFDPRQPVRYFSQVESDEWVEVIDITDRVSELP